MATPSFPADKEELWAGYTKENDHWVLSHNSLRGEIKELDTCFDALKDVEQLTEWQIDSITKVWKYHSEHVHMHHKSEEDILQPFISTRVKLPESIHGGHEELTKNLNEINQIIDELSNTDNWIKFKDLFTTYKDGLLKHLTEEEETVIPLIHAYFTPEEFKTTGKNMGKAGGHSGSFVYYIGEEKFRNETMQSMGIPFFVWHVAFSKAMKEYQTNVLTHVTAISKGEPPVKEESKWFGLF